MPFFHMLANFSFFKKIKKRFFAHVLALPRVVGEPVGHEVVVAGGAAGAGELAVLFF